ncbi:MAG: ribose-5-phosphate isomerase RpiA [Candidatus Thalassarchaeaceae archaeon]|jgi:ribose 5-phosphate isomerase A|nr:ribose-5-phosphate isomerase RpiA [Candidatus Thalassarchaeaceae archaeon]
MGDFSDEEKAAMKKAAGIAACEFVKNGMKVGLGTGSTVKYTILELGRRIREEGLKIQGIPTSEQTEIISIEQGIELVNWADCSGLDIVIDGADEFDSELHLIKGGGGALLREKIVAESSGSMVVVADATKKVQTLGDFPLPVEVNPYGWEQTMRRLQNLCPGEVLVRKNADGSTFLTDNGNPILDACFGSTIDKPREMEAVIRSIAGVVEVGLFVDIADVIVLAAQNGCEIIRKENSRI